MGFDMYVDACISFHIRRDSSHWQSLDPSIIHTGMLLGIFSAGFAPHTEGHQHSPAKMQREISLIQQMLLEEL